MRLTSITLKVNGAEIRASVAGTLTSGMVGIPVKIEYDEAWEGLTKNLVCRCSGWDADSTEQRAILNVGPTAVVAHEVMQAGKHLYLGIEGYSADGTLVIPTTWAMCGVVQKGANTGEDLSADPTLPIWGQLQAQIDQIEGSGIPPEQLEEIRACLDSASRAAQSAAISAGRAEGAAARAEDAVDSAQQSPYELPVGGAELGGVKNGGNVVIYDDGTMDAPVSALTDDQIAGAVSGWLDEHPEVTTTVADKSITPGKTDFLVDRKPLEPEALNWETAGYNMIANVGYLDIRGVETITVVHTGAALRDVALALYTESQTQIQGFTVVSSTENQQIHYSDSGVSTNVTTLDIPSLIGDTNAAFARIRVHQATTNADSLFVYLGDPNAEPGFCWTDKYGPPKLPDGAITLRQTNFYTATGQNLIDTSRFEVTGYSGELYEQVGANMYVFSPIDMSVHKAFYIRAYVGAFHELAGVKIACYDAEGRFINADGSLVTATKLRGYSDIVVENNQYVSGGNTWVYRYEVDDSVSFVRFAAKVAISSGNIAPAQLKYVISSYEDILDMTSPPEQYWRGISDEWRDAIRAADATTPKTMDMIGDSLTNWGGGGDGTDGFLRIVHDKTGVVTTNEGTAGAWWQLMPGETADGISTNGVGRVNAIIRDGRKYDLYCFMLGTNAGANTDTGETSADPSTMPGAIRYCLEKLKAYDPTGQILVCLPPQRAEGNELQEKTNEVIAKIAAEYAVPTLDIYHRSGIVPNTKIQGVGYLQDGLHLAEPGCTVLGKLLAAEVKHLLCLH